MELKYGNLSFQEVSWFLRMSVATLFEVSKFSENFNYEKRLSDALSHLCIHEEFEISLPTKLLYSMSSTATKQSKLLELTELETSFLAQSLKLFKFPRDKWSRFRWTKGEPCVSINLKLDLLFLMKLFELNSNNCKQFIEAEPLEILAEMSLIHDTRYRDQTVQLIHSCVINSRQHRAKIIKSLDPILQIMHMKELFEGIFVVHVHIHITN